MRNPGPRALTALLLLVATVFVLRAGPFAANRDDHVRLYFGAYAGGVQLAGGPAAAAFRAELQETAAAFGDAYTASRFLVAQTPYSPLTLASVAVAEAVRPRTSPTHVLSWVLAEQTLLWAAMLLVALRARAALPACPLRWFLAAGLPLAWIHAHTAPLYPVPRAFACLFTAVALGLAATGAAWRWTAACLVLAAASHPYNQAANLAVALPAAALMAGTAAAPALRARTLVRFAATGSAAVAAALAVVALANPRSSLALAGLLGERPVFDPAGAWALLGTSVFRLSVAVGLPLVALVFRYCGRGRAAALAVYVALTLVAAATLPPASHYPGEYLSRVGGGWVAVLFGLCLRQDLLPDLTSAAVGRRAAVIAATVLVALPAAVPELANVPNTIHRPLGAPPPRLSVVEWQCLRILGRTPVWPATRSQGEADSNAMR